MTIHQNTALRVAAAVALTALAVGCGSSRPAFQPDGYYDGERAYFVASVDGSGAILPSAQWALDNYEVYDGNVGPERDTEGYAVWQKFDTDGDGTYETEQRFSFYDLLLVERGGKGRIAVRTEPLPAKMSNESLSTLVETYIGAVGKSGMMPASFGKPYSEAASPYVTRTEKLVSGTLDGAPAHEATFDFAASADDMAAGRRARVVIIDPGFVSKVGSREFKSVLIASYVNTPDAFDGGMEAFDALLDRIALLSHDEVVQSRAQQIFDCRGVDDTVEVAVTLDDKANVVSAVDRKPGETVVDDGRTCASVVLADAPFRRVPPKQFTLEVTRNAPPPPEGGYLRAGPPAPVMPAAPAVTPAAEGTAPADGTLPADVPPPGSGAGAKAPAAADGALPPPPPPEPAPAP